MFFCGGFAVLGARHGFARLVDVGGVAAWAGGVFGAGFGEGVRPRTGFEEGFGFFAEDHGGWWVVVGLVLAQGPALGGARLWPERS